LKFVKQPPEHPILLPYLGPQAHLNVLIRCGADLSATVLEKGVEKNAAQLNTKPALRKLLEPTSG
jgi:hypothetical protein